MHIFRLSTEIEVIAKDEKDSYLVVERLVAVDDDHFLELDILSSREVERE